MNYKQQLLLGTSMLTVLGLSVTAFKSAIYFGKLTLRHQDTLQRARGIPLITNGHNNGRQHIFMEKLRSRKGLIVFA